MSRPWLGSGDVGESGETWYLQEVEGADRAAITHFDFRLSASKRVSPQQARQLIALLQTAPKPILIHCQAGADRTGMAAMLYLQQIAGIDEEISERQLSVRYGHIGLPYISAAFAMDESWEILEEVLFGLTS
ncbi:tyrosine-protein phosphatase [Sinorhizobium meliloti]|uniref:tyrosine-protein phosphatase n=1 Tax=Rhizobium meliloti TaxID=382 RepID=UPI00307E3842